MTRKKNKNQLGMTNDDNACIRYLMKEMDPSEEVLMERAMMEDDDLLIEVECMRQTLRRLDGLPKVNPPAHLRDAIIKEAVEHRQKTLNSYRFLPSLNFRQAAAAIFVVATTAGGFLLYGDYNTNEASADLSEQAVTQATANSATNTDVDPQGTLQKIQFTAVDDNLPDPWIDRNNVIYFQDQYREDNSAFQSLIKSSTEKLTPLNDSFYYNAGSRSLQLTGSETNQ